MLITDNRKKYLIIASLNDDFRNLSYVSNLSPITWTGDIMEAKPFYDYEDAKIHIFKNYNVYKDIVSCTDISKISILSFSSGCIKTIIDKEGQLLAIDE